jgi:uncharacterized protein (DUF2141 family)
MEETELYLLAEKPMKTLIALFVGCAVWIQEPFSQAGGTGTLRLKITQLRNDRGKVNLSLYQSKDGYPSDPKKAFKKIKAEIREGICEITLVDLPRGEYAISLMHDENENEKMDTGFLGIPKEGYGASNDAKAVLGPPKYADARFLLDKPEVRMEIKAKYF